MKHPEKTKRPLILTVKGKAAAVLRDAAAYQRLLDLTASSDGEDGIRQGLEDAMRGKLRPAREVFEDFETANGIPR